MNQSAVVYLGWGDISVNNKKVQYFILNFAVQINIKIVKSILDGLEVHCHMKYLAHHKQLFAYI